jgi:hypothetical protein
LLASVLLMSMKLQVLSMSFRTPRQGDIEPMSVADSLRECATTSPRVWQIVVDDVEDGVLEVLFSELSEQPL